MRTNSSRSFFHTIPGDAEKGGAEGSAAEEEEAGAEATESGEGGAGGIELEL